MTCPVNVSVPGRRALGTVCDGPTRTWPRRHRDLDVWAGHLGPRGDHLYHEKCSLLHGHLPFPTLSPARRASRVRVLLWPRHSLPLSVWVLEARSPSPRPRPALDGERGRKPGCETEESESCVFTVEPVNAPGPSEAGLCPCFVVAGRALQG